MQEDAGESKTTAPRAPIILASLLGLSLFGTNAIVLAHVSFSTAVSILYFEMAAVAVLFVISGVWHFISYLKGASKANRS